MGLGFPPFRGGPFLTVPFSPPLTPRCPQRHPQWALARLQEHVRRLDGPDHGVRQGVPHTVAVQLPGGRVGEAGGAWSAGAARVSTASPEGSLRW